MNFRFTKGKVIGSVVITLVVWILVFTIGPSYSNPPSFIRGFLEIHNGVNIFSLGNISLFIIELIIVYIIWSLIQKRNY